MPNPGRYHVGNAKDWEAVHSQVVVGSPMKDAGVRVSESVRDLQAGRIREVHLANPQAVRLSIVSDLPADLRARSASVTDI